jgi:hypothetical protein
VLTRFGVSRELQSVGLKNRALLQGKNLLLQRGIKPIEEAQYSRPALDFSALAHE